MKREADADALYEIIKTVSIVALVLGQPETLGWIGATDTLSRCYLSTT